MSRETAYLSLLQDGELARRVFEADTHLARCDLCAQACGIDRQAGELGICRTGVRAHISSYGPHLGEEDPLRGWRGSGTIFFSRCNLKCQFCQNYDISQVETGREVSPEELAAIMLELQERGCHNINFVSPSHVIAPILAAVHVAAENGLHLPLVYNTGGYDSLAALALLDGVVDIYMPDMKYSNEENGLKYSSAKTYPAINQAAVREMHRQVGDLVLDERGIARRGLLVRHLILPDDLAGTEQILRFLAEEISKDTYLNLMNQYCPAYHAANFPELNRTIHREEYEQTVAHARLAGLKRLDQRRLFWNP